MSKKLYRDWPTLFYEARVKSGLYGKLYIFTEYNPVIGPRLEVHIVNDIGEKVLQVYGLNDGHRGQGWIHYNEKIQADLIDIYEEAREARDKFLSQQKDKREKERVKEQERVSKILNDY